MCSFLCNTPLIRNDRIENKLTLVHGIAKSQISGQIRWTNLEVYLKM